MQAKKIEPVDVHNDAQMVKLGIRCPMYEGRDSSVWSKTLSEKKSLEKAKSRASKEKLRTGVPPRRAIPVKSKLIVYLKKNNKFQNTTYSKICYQHEIPDILSFFSGESKSKKIVNFVTKYTWNGREYNSKDLPFWNL